MGPLGMRLTFTLEILPVVLFQRWSDCSLSKSVTRQVVIRLKTGMKHPPLIAAGQDEGRWHRIFLTAENIFLQHHRAQQKVIALTKCKDLGLIPQALWKRRLREVKWLQVTTGREAAVLEPSPVAPCPGSAFCWQLSLIDQKRLWRMGFIWVLWVTHKKSPPTITLKSCPLVMLLLFPELCLTPLLPWLFSTELVFLRHPFPHLCQVLLYNPYPRGQMSVDWFELQVGNVCPTCCESSMRWQRLYCDIGIVQVRSCLASSILSPSVALFSCLSFWKLSFIYILFLTR